MARLKELNPGLRRQGHAHDRERRGDGLEFQTDQVSDISPVRGLTRCGRSTVPAPIDGHARATGDLAPLRGLPLTELSCLYTSVSDLAPLKDMDLTIFDCRHTNVSDADVKHLAGLKSLRTLSLWGTKVTDAGLKELAGLKSLSGSASKPPRLRTRA